MVIFCRNIWLIFSLYVFWCCEDRTICSVGNHSVTIWKTYGGAAYIIPRKYYGLTLPKSNFLKTDNRNEGILFYWNDSLKNTIIYRDEDYYDFDIYVNNDDTSKIHIINFDSDKDKYQCLISDSTEENYRKLNASSHYVEFTILENYLVGKK